MSFRIPRQDTELRFVTKVGDNRPLRSCRKVVWITIYKKLGLRRTRPSPHFGQNRPIAPKIPWTLTLKGQCSWKVNWKDLDMSTYTEFGPDRLRFAGLIPERLIFQPKKSIQYYRPTNINSRALDFVIGLNVADIFPYHTMCCQTSKLKRYTYLRKTSLARIYTGWVKNRTVFEIR